MINNFLLAKASSIQKVIRTMNIGLDIACSSQSTFLKNSSDFFFRLRHIVGKFLNASERDLLFVKQNKTNNEWNSINQVL